MKPPRPSKRVFPGPKLKTSFYPCLLKRAFMTLLPKNTPVRVRKRLALMFPIAGKKVIAKDRTANVENVVNAPINPVPKASFP